MADYDVIVIGSGFGGSVSALRLTEKGYRVAVLEAGRRFTETTCRKTSWHIRSFLWAPTLGRFGIQRIHLLERRDPGRRRRRRRLAQLRQHAVRAARSRSTTIRSGGTSPTGGRSWRRSTTRPSGCSASSTNPTMTQSDVEMKRWPSSSAGPTRSSPRRSACSSGAGAGAGQDVPDPFFGGVGPGPHGLHRVRLVHDRLPPRREEHPATELPRPGRAGRAQRCIR